MRIKIIVAAAALAVFTGCSPQNSETPTTETTTNYYGQASSGGGEVADEYLQEFSTSGDSAAGSGSEASLDLAPDEGLVLADHVLLASAKGGDVGSFVLLSSKVKVLDSGDGWSHVQAGDQTGWVPSGAIATEVRRAVLKANGPEGWPKLTVVGYRPIEGKDDTVQAFAFGTDSPRTADLPRRLLSFNSNDVNLIVLWRVAALESESAARAAVLNQALARYSSSAFAAMVQDKVDELSGKTVLATTAVSIIVAAVADDTKVWPEPAAKGTPVDTLAAGQQAQVVEQSEPQTVGGQTARWYKIADPVGWVFGATVKE